MQTYKDRKERAQAALDKATLRARKAYSIAVNQALARFDKGRAAADSTETRAVAALNLGTDIDMMRIDYRIALAAARAVFNSCW